MPTTLSDSRRKHSSIGRLITMAGEVRVRVANQRELDAAFRNLEPAARKELAVGLTKVAEIVRRVAVSKIPRLTGAARASLKVRKSARSVRLAAGGGKAPYYPWLDFGGRVGRNNATLRPFLKEGRFIYPTLRERRLEITKAVEDAVEAAWRKEGFRVR